MKNFIFFVALFCTTALFSQVENPIKFDFSQSSDTLIVNTTIQKGWHLYAVHLPNPEEGPLPTEFVFTESKDYSITGKIVEGEGHTEMDETFGIKVKYFENNATFKQLIKMNTSQTEISGTVYYMVCNESMCVNFETPFKVPFEKK